MKKHALAEQIKSLKSYIDCRFAYTDDELRRLGSAVDVLEREAGRPSSDVDAYNLIAAEWRTVVDGLKAERDALKAERDNLAEEYDECYTRKHHYINEAAEVRDELRLIASYVEAWKLEGEPEQVCATVHRVVSRLSILERALRDKFGDLDTVGFTNLLAGIRDEEAIR